MNKKRLPEKYRLHHIGIVVKDVHTALRTYLDHFERTDITYKFEFVPSQKVEICMISTLDQTTVEFIEPAGEDSPVFEFSRDGGGLHHLCYETEDIESAIKELDMKIIEKPVIGFESRKIAFVFEKTGDMGVSLIELAQTKNN
ncbi:VOC family protein [[Clostridium] polysaccharolyticum]|uniref:Methylmalonyl-CoA/ethylmalonyl-CoA epimerase n=1 Tax=[Clostridium] polysaccharolyticum TaxID=29364 RepID=A0A1I0C3V7_9FIRM|nr:VOC family protein [[Clostridium] polysaccharolyticum]SET14148.1 methylmalonyl-CoA/ethylmalonyl-CoA epimerase [[Clostridium] polysaccharolyticum]